MNRVDCYIASHVLVDEDPIQEAHSDAPGVSTIPDLWSGKRCSIIGVPVVARHGHVFAVQKKYNWPSA